MPKNELIVKDVDFFGDTLKAARDEKGIVWAGIPWLCKGIGLGKDQTGYERKKIQDDLVLSQGVKFYPLGTGNANKDVLCLQLDYVPLWLAKISITPNMKENNPELVDKLVKYQLKAKDVLAAAFLPVLKLPKLTSMAEVEKKEPYARLFKTDSGGIVLMNDMVYNLSPGEMEHLSRFVSELEKQSIGHMPYVVSSFLKSLKKSRKLEETASWGVRKKEPAEMLPDKG